MSDEHLPIKTPIKPMYIFMYTVHIHSVFCTVFCTVYCIVLLYIFFYCHHPYIYESTAYTYGLAPLAPSPQKLIFHLGVYSQPKAVQKPKGIQRTNTILSHNSLTQFSHTLLFHIQTYL